MNRGWPILASLLSGCAPQPSFRGVDVSSGRSIEIVPDDKRSGNDFTGTYWSAQVGAMTLSQAGTALSGQYLYHSCDCIVRGKIAGDVEGNLAKVRWTEESPCRGGWRAGGKGYLFYRHAPQSDRPARLFGTRQYVGGTEHPGDGLSRQTLGEVTWTAVVVAASDVASRGPATCP